MTQNQISLRNVKELERHNQAMEAENVRHSKVSEALDKWKNELTAIGLRETARSNVAQERLKEQQNAINAQQAAENVRHNVEYEALTAAANRSQAALNAANASNAYASAQLSKANIPYVEEKSRTEQSMQGLNRAKTTTESFQPNYVMTQNALNRAKVVNVQQDTQLKEYQTLRTGVNAVWESINGALNTIFMGGRMRR